MKLKRTCLRLGLTIIGLALTVLFQNCGLAKEPMVEVSCMVSRIGPTIYVDGVIHDIKNPVVVLKDQTVQLQVGYTGFITPPSCGPSGGAHWQLPDGSKVFNFCLTHQNPTVGSHSVKWAHPHLACEHIPEPIIDEIRFTVN